MKRISLVFALWTLVLIFVINSNNVYLNALALFIGFIASVCAISWIMDNMKESEKTSFNKLLRIFN